MIRIALQHTKTKRIHAGAPRTPYNRRYARLVDSAGPLDGRGDCVSTFFFPLLALVFLGYQRLSDGWGRGLILFLLLVAAVTTREIARLLVAAWLGLRLRAVLLLPIGGLFAYANPESQEGANAGPGQYALALAGPVANWATALHSCRRPSLGASSDVHLFDTPIHQARHICCAALGLDAGLPWPAAPVARRAIRSSCGRLIRANFARKHGYALAGRAAAGLGQALALAADAGGGMLLHDYWMAIAGFFIMIGAQIEDQGVFFQSVVDTVHMREVMLTDFATLSPSDTLADALGRCVHSLQEDFPVVRGPQLVGIVSRQRIVDALRNDGNGYVQSVMSRAFQVACPDDTLGTTIRRLTAGHGLALIPITESGRVVGIVQRAKPDELHVSAGRKAPFGTRRSQRVAVHKSDSTDLPLAPWSLSGCYPYRQLGRHHAARA